MESVPTAPAAKPLGDATTQLVVLAFDLVGQQLGNFPTLLENSLKTKSVQDAIQSTLDDFILKRMAFGKGSNDLTSKDATDLLNAITSSTSGKLGDAALAQVKNSPEYKKLERAFSDFQASAKATPMGVWVDQHSRLVFVTGVALVIGGAAVLFATRTGGTVMNTLVGQIKGKPVQVFKVGQFILQGQMLAFQPDKRILGAGVIATQKWQSLQISLSLGVVAAGPSVQQINGQLVLKSHDLNLGLTASDASAKKTINLGVTLGFDGSSLKPKLGLGAIITGGKISGGTLDASLTTPIGDFGGKGQMSGREYQGLLTYTWHF